MHTKKYLPLLLLCAVFLSGCHSDHKKVKEKTTIIVAREQTPIQRLYFTGSLSPIQTIPVISPVAGNIVKRDFEYGERVEKDKVLFKIDSKTLADDYHKDVSDFIQKKQAFETGEDSFKGTQVLYKAGVIAKEDYTNDKTTYENKKLDYLEAKYKLEKVLKTANINEQKVDVNKVESLTLADTNRVNELLQQHFRNIEIKAPGSGVALFPKKTMSEAAGSTGKLETGDPVKAQQLLLSIGDLSGLSAAFDVSEVDIDRIKENMSVIVTGSAFPGDTLHGNICAVSVQANQGTNNGGLSMYTVNIEIPHVDPAVMKKIRVGMTAKFEVDIKGEPRIMIPVGAVSLQNGKSVVTVMNAKNKPQVVPVQTGITTPTDVVIIGGIKAGDKILIKEPVEGADNK